MKVSAPYGGRRIEFDIPKKNLLIVASPKLRRTRSDLQTIKKALANPIGSKKLSELARPESKVAIAVTDSTRPVPNSKILPLVLGELEESGVKDENITIIIATGMHRQNTEEEIKRNIGEKAAKRFSVVNHNPEDRANIREFGKTQLGTEIQVNKTFADADLKIVTGAIMPCMLSGWCGSGKTVMPGVSSRKSIEQNHALFAKNFQNLDRGAMGGIVENNFVRKDIDDCATRAKLDFAVNVSLNERKEVMQAFAGHPENVHRQGVEFGKDAMKTAVPERADIVIAGPGFVEYEVSLYQSASRTFATVENVIKERGTIILVSSCHRGLYEGIGKEIEFYRDWLTRLPKPKEILEMTAKNEVPSFESCILYQFSWMMQRFSIKVLTKGMSESELEEIGLGYVSSPSEAINESLRKHGEDAKIAVVPYASITYVSPIPSSAVSSSP